MAIQHKNIPDAQLHEVKGAASASSNQILRANGDGTASFWTPTFTNTAQGVWDYNDTLTSTSPILLTTAGAEYQLTNNGAGVNTNTTYGLPGVSIYNTSTGYFNFSDLKLGDSIDVRVDAELTTTSASNLLTLIFELGIGTTPYKLNVDQRYFKTASAHKVVANAHIYIGNTVTKNGLGRFLASCDSTGSSVKINGWYIRVLTNG
jgi:hypothetical protein